MSNGGLWSQLTERARLRAFGIASLAAFGMAYWVGVNGQALQTSVSPFGIVSLELAGTTARAQRIYDAWGETGRQIARFNIQIDFLYLVAYGIALSLGCAVARLWWQPRSALLARVGAALTWLMPVAAGCDAIENMMMWNAMRDTTEALWPALALVFAIAKFAVLGVGLLYIMLGAFSRIGQRNSLRAR